MLFASEFWSVSHIRLSSLSLDSQYIPIGVRECVKPPGKYCMSLYGSVGMLGCIWNMLRAYHINNRL